MSIVLCLLSASVGACLGAVGMACVAVGAKYDAIRLEIKLAQELSQARQWAWLWKQKAKEYRDLSEHMALSARRFQTWRWPGSDGDHGRLFVDTWDGDS